MLTLGPSWRLGALALRLNLTRLTTLGLALGLGLSVSSPAPGEVVPAAAPTFPSALPSPTPVPSVIPRRGLAPPPTPGPSAEREELPQVAVATSTPDESRVSMTAPNDGASPTPALRCAAPEPTARWRGRADDDAWAQGLYPARERYPEGWLALTFDDGPHPTRTPEVLDQLAAHQLHATFFLTGFAIRASTYHLVQRMVEEGHTLANHGWRHDIDMAQQQSGTRELERYIESEFELTQVRVDLAMMARDADDFTTMEHRVFDRLHRGRSRERQLSAMEGLRERHRALLEERGYAEGERPLALRWARPPGGRPYLGRYTSAERNAFARVLARQGLSLVMWNGGSGDSAPKLSHRERMDPERIKRTVEKAVKRGGIYVAHDRMATRALVAMVDAVASSDAEIVSLAQLEQAKHQARGWCQPTGGTSGRPALAAP